MKALVWDVETLPMVTYCWDLRQKYNTHENIVQEWAIVCASWMVIDEDKRPRAVSILDDAKRAKQSVYDDTFVVKTLHDILSKADIYVYQNGDNFDLKMFNARAIALGLEPLPKKDSVDTLKESRKIAKLPSHRLDYQGRFYLGEGKMETGGMELWRQIAQYDFGRIDADPDFDMAEKAVKKMVRYNKRDVKLTADLYLKLRPYMKKHPNRQLYEGDVCPACGSDNYTRDGHAYYGMGKFMRFRCKECKRRWVHSRAVERVSTKLA